MVEKGEDVTELEVGARIAIENHFYCGDCYNCEVSIFQREYLTACNDVIHIGLCRETEVTFART